MGTMCRFHKKKLKFYCITCNACICSMCVPSHSGHQFADLEESWDSIRKNAQTLLEWAEAAVNELNDIKNRVDAQLTESISILKESKEIAKGLVKMPSPWVLTYKDPILSCMNKLERLKTFHLAHGYEHSLLNIPYQPS